MVRGSITACGIVLVAALATSCGGVSGPVACGQDISDMRSTIIGLHPEDGRTLWTTEIGLVSGGGFDPATGQLRFRKADERTRSWIGVDAATGEALGEVEPYAGPPKSNVAPPPTIDGVTVSHVWNERGSLAGADATSGEVLWTTELPRPDQGTEVVEAGSVAAVIQGDSVPSCG